jgi:hypothetical protein
MALVLNNGIYWSPTVNISPISGRIGEMSWVDAVGLDMDGAPLAAMRFRVVLEMFLH